MLWDLISLTCINTFQFPLISSLEFSPDDSYLACGFKDDDEVRIWDVISGYWYNALRGHANSVVCLLWTDDGVSLISGSLDSTIRIWDIRLSRCKKIIQGVEIANVMQLSTDNKILFVGCSFSRINSYQIETGETLKTILLTKDNFAFDGIIF
jgi:WD40 repeat protein